MAQSQSPHIGLQGPFTNLPFGICATYFHLKVNFSLFRVNFWPILMGKKDGHCLAPASHHGVFFFQESFQIDKCRYEGYDDPLAE